jgi:hypothetical protein
MNALPARLVRGNFLIMDAAHLLATWSKETTLTSDTMQCYCDDPVCADNGSGNNGGSVGNCYSLKAVVFVAMVIAAMTSV